MAALRFLPLGLILAGLIAATAFGWTDLLTLEALGQRRAALEQAVAAHPLLAPFAFGSFFIVVTLFSLPIAGLLTVMGGFLFGWEIATLTITIAATLGATAVFLAARTAFAAGLRERVRTHAGMLADGFERDAFGYLLVLRLTPILPFLIVNVAPALFNVRLSTYVATTFLGILPGTVALAYLGEGIGSVLIAATRAGRSPTLNEIVTPQIAIALAALAGLSILAMAAKAFWSWRSGRGG